MPRPWTATSWEVMPPLATTQAGLPVRAPRTTSTTAAETVRAISRLPAASVPRTSLRLLYSSTSESARAARTRLVTSVDMGVAPGRVQQGGDVEFDLGQAAAGAGDWTWRLVSPTWDPTTISPCPAGEPVGQSSAAVSGALGSSPASARTNDGPVR